jgi:hypothetical protein
MENEIRGWERTAARLRAEVSRLETQISNSENDEDEMLARALSKVTISPDLTFLKTSGSLIARALK